MQIKHWFLDAVLHADETSLTFETCAKKAIRAGVNLFGADLRNRNFGCMDFSGAKLSLANLGGSNLSGCNLSKADLYGAIFDGANLKMANLSGAELKQASFKDTDLRFCNFCGAYTDFLRLSCLHHEVIVIDENNITWGCERNTWAYFKAHGEGLMRVNKYTEQQKTDSGALMGFIDSWLAMKQQNKKVA